MRWRRARAGSRRHPVAGLALQLSLWLVVGVFCSGAASSSSSSPETEVEAAVAVDPEAKLETMGIVLREPSPPVANYLKAVRSGDLVFLSGHGPYRGDGTLVQGKIGRELTVDEGYEAARLTAIDMLATLKAEIGDLNKVRRIVKVVGMVNSDPSFTDQPQVIDGCSDLLVEVFGERGRHARAAVGMTSLPVGIAVEIEMIVEVE